MESCVVQSGLFGIGNLYLYTLVVLAGIAFTKRNLSGFWLASVTALFYAISKAYHCEIKAFDQWHVLRYLFWVGLDLLYLCTVYLWVSKAWIIKKPVLQGLLILHLFMWFLHCARIVDIHLLPSLDMKDAYGIGIAVSNFFIVLLVVAQVIPSQKDLRGDYGNNNRTNRDRSRGGSFAARNQGL
ncbi:MAG TPA: hypothetical protein DCS87_11790 [Rheinheimera sp.]|nr:hypothetical protein [Rheinheimera sp.]